MNPSPQASADAASDSYKNRLKNDLRHSFITAQDIAIEAYRGDFHREHDEPTMALRQDCIIYGPASLPLAA